MIDISKFVEIVDKSKNKAETLMLFRCTTLEYAEHFLETGNIRFGTPQEWIDYFKTHGDGRGDLLEGSFASIHTFDERPVAFYKHYRPQVHITKDKRNGNLYFQSSDVLMLRTFCLFGLDRALFTQELEAEDRKLYPTGSISKRYFEDFSEIKEDTYSNLPKEKKPVLLMIKNPKEFFQRLKQSLYKLGFEDNEFIIHPVGYMDKQEQFLIGDPLPGELFLKDMSFSYQSEIRVVLTPHKSSLTKLIEQKNGIIDLGNMKDIAEIQEYYFDDFHMQLRGNTILFSLPNAIETPISDPMTVISHIHQLYRDELPGPLLSIEKRDLLIDEACAFLQKHFGISFDKNSLTFTNSDGSKTWKLQNIWDILYGHGFSYYSRGEFEKSVDQYTKAILIDPQKPAAWYNRAVSYYKLGDYQKMLNDMNRAIELDPTNEKYIKERDDQLKNLGISVKPFSE